MALSDAGREITWNVSHAWVMYIFAGASALVFGYGIWKRISYWRKGKSAEDRWTDFGSRLWFVIKELLLQRRTRKDSFPGYFHSFVFYSFIVLFITTLVVMADYDFGTSFFKGPFYVLLSLGSDLAGLLVLIGVGMAAWRRYVTRPKMLTNGLDDMWSLVILGLLVLTGFFIEGVRIAVAGDPWKWVSPVGMVFAAPFAGIGESGGRTAHVVLWWTHTVLATGWIATIPFTKFFHIISLPANMFFSKMTPRGELSRVDIEKMMEADDFDEESFSFGTERSTDFTWKELLDFDACTSCGRCEEVCPATLADQPFSPKDFIASLKELA